MIYSLSGKIIKKTLNAVVVSCGGVGYYVQCPTSVAGALPGVGREATLYTVMSVTENDISPNQSSFTVPEGCLFFLGDNRSGSNDARYWEESYIPVGNVKAHVLLAISLTGGSSWQGVRAIG